MRDECPVGEVTNATGDRGGPLACGLGDRSEESAVYRAFEAGALSLLDVLKSAIRSLSVRLCVSSLLSLRPCSCDAMPS